MQPTKRPPLAQMRTTLEQARLEARRSVALAERALAVAVAMREDALDMRLNAWIEHLSLCDPLSSRESVLQRCLDAAISTASADYGNIQLVHPTRYGLEIKAQRGFGAPFLDFFEFVDDGFSACGLALLDREPIVVDDVTTSPVFVETQSLGVVLEAGVRAVQSTPLIGRDGRVLGMLSVHHREPQNHAKADLARFQTLADAISDRIISSLSR